MEENGVFFAEKREENETTNGHESTRMTSTSRFDGDRVRSESGVDGSLWCRTPQGRAKGEGENPEKRKSKRRGREGPWRSVRAAVSP